MEDWSQKLSGRISQKAVDDTVRRKGELVTAGRYSTSRRIASDFNFDDSSVLGAGATGKVHLATRVGGHRCAVKSVQKKKLSKSARDLLMNEAGLYLSLDHPHIAKLEQVYESRSELHFVMEHLSGGELLTRLKREGKFNEIRAADAMRQMLLAVAYLHAHGIAHRDLKPENFVYDRVGGHHLKMIDFGFASRFTEDSRMSQPCGSLHYVAPEVLTKSYNEKADLWSMGVIAYTLLCGRSPWHPYKDSRKDTLKKVTAGEVAYCPERFDSLSNDAKDFVKALLTLDPAKRLSAAEALEHPWIQQTMAALPMVDDEVAHKLKSTERTTPFRKICLSMAASTLSQKQTEHLCKQFHAFDRTNNGALTLDSFRELVGEENQLDVDTVFANADLGNDGEIGFTSFVVASMDQRPSQDVLRPLFNRLDADKNGKISARDLRSVLGPCFEGLSPSDLIKEADLSGDGCISWPEFCAYMMQGDLSNFNEMEDSIEPKCFLKLKVDDARSWIRRVSGRMSLSEADGIADGARNSEDPRGVAKLFLRLPLRATM